MALESLVWHCIVFVAQLLLQQSCHQALISISNLAFECWQQSNFIFANISVLIAYVSRDNVCDFR